MRKVSNPSTNSAKAKMCIRDRAISPDGRWLAAGRFNGTLSLYDVKNDKVPAGQWTVFAPRQPAAGEERKQVASQ